MKRKVYVLTTFILVFSLTFGCIAEAATVGDEGDITSKGAVVMDYDSGDILYSYNAETQRVPASMTKLLCMYCIYDAIAEGKINMNTIIPISDNAYSIATDSEYSNVDLDQQTAYTVDELMDAVIIVSACGATLALAEYISGSEENFVSLMNQKAKELGTAGRFYDCWGISDNNLISPHEIALIAQSFVKSYPDILKRTSKEVLWFHGKKYESTNELLGVYLGMDGLKTGTTNAAGCCFTSTAVQNGRRLISVTMGSKNNAARFSDTTILMNYGYKEATARYDTIYYTDMRVFIDGYEMPTFVYNGTVPHAVVVAEDLSVYGFDITYNEETKTVHLKKDNSEVSPIPLDIYKNKNGQKAFTRYNSDIKVVIDFDNGSYNLKDVYNVNGYCCISIDELADLYDFEWSNADNAAYITTK